MFVFGSFPRSRIDRRDFLKIGGISAAALVLFPDLLKPKLLDIQKQEQDSTPTLGRITSNTAELFAAPSFKANRLKFYWKDLVFPITGVTIGEDPAYNRVWYAITTRVTCILALFSRWKSL